MGVSDRHKIACVHLTNHRALDIVNCNDSRNRFLLEEYCKKCHVNLTYCSNNEAINLLVSLGGTGFGVFTCCDTDDKNECLYRKSMARHSQLQLSALIGVWVFVEPLELIQEESSDVIRLVIG
jgi:hypothetical protein